DQAKRKEDDRCGQPDRRVGGDEPDEGRGYPHARQRDDEGVLPAHLVAEPPEEERAQRPDQEADREDRHGTEESRHGVARVEELDGQDRGQTPEDVKVVPLDDIADGRRDDDATEILERNPGWRHGFLTLLLANGSSLHDAGHGAPRVAAAASTASRSTTTRCGTSIGFSKQALTEGGSGAPAARSGGEPVISRNGRRG